MVRLNRDSATATQDNFPSKEHAARQVISFLMVVLTLLSGVPRDASAQPGPSTQDRSPNIVFIMADDLGYGDLTAYGDDSPIETPNIDQLAAKGVRFTNFYAGSTVCAPSRSVLMTGQHLGHTYIRGNGGYNLRLEDYTVAELLQKAGYRTGQFGKWGLGEENSDGIPTRQGFDYFYGYLDQGHAHNYYPEFLVHNEERVMLENEVRPLETGKGDDGQGIATKKVEYSHDLIAEEALAFIDRNRDEPFFLYVPFTIPHANNEGGRATGDGMEVPNYGSYAEKDWPKQEKGFAAMITRMDKDVGRILDRLEKYGIDENTVVFFTSDNGPHAEGGHDSEFFDSNGPLRGIKRDLYEGGIRVPMIVHWPGHTPAGKTSDYVGYFGDLMATAADIANVEPPENIDSNSFLPAITGRADDQQSHDYLYWEFYEGQTAQAVRKGKWKAVRVPMGPGDIELYNLEQDLGEERDVADAHPEIVARMKQIMTGAHEPSKHWSISE